MLKQCSPLYSTKLPYWPGSQISAVSSCVSVFKLSEIHINCISWVTKLTQGLLASHKIKPLQRNVTTPLQFKKINYRDTELEREHLPPLSLLLPSTYLPKVYIREFLWINRFKKQLWILGAQVLLSALRNLKIFWMTRKSLLKLDHLKLRYHNCPQIISLYVGSNNFQHAWWLHDLLPVTSKSISHSMTAL